MGAVNRRVKSSAAAWRVLGFATILGLIPALVALPARADPTERAARLYDDGAAAYDRRDYDGALQALAAADALAPDATTLVLALNAASRSRLAVLALETADRALFRGERFLPLARSVRARFATQVGTLQILCTRCAARLDDGAPLAPGVPRYALPGRRRVVAELLGREHVYEVEVKGGQLLVLRIEEAPRLMAPERVTPSSAESARSSGARDFDGVRPGWFWGGLGLTAALSIATGVSALDTRARHADFERAPSSTSAQSGRASQRRTNWLAAGSLASALGTAVLGLVVVRWGDAPRLQARSSH